MPVWKFFSLASLVFTQKTVLKNQWILISTAYAAILVLSGHLVLHFNMSFFSLAITALTL